MVEILIAIAIVAVLTLLLVPTFSVVRNRAMEAGCAQNLRQIMKSVHHYVADNDGYMPWIAPNGEGYAAGDGVNTHSVNVALGVGGYFDENPLCLQCPGWVNWKRNGAAHSGQKPRPPINTADGQGRNSIRNTYEWRGLRPVNYNPPSGKWATVPRIKMALINQPSKEWYVCDAAPGSAYSSKRSTFSHGTRGGFAAYVDGHVSWLSIQNPQQWTSTEAYYNFPLEITDQFRRN